MPSAATQHLISTPRPTEEYHLEEQDMEMEDPLVENPLEEDLQSNKGSTDSDWTDTQL